MGEKISDLEQQEYYAQVAKKTSESLAYFYCCIKYDVPFARDCVPRDGSSELWLAYIDNLHLKKRDVGKDGQPLGFLGGLTDITKIFGEGLKDGEFTKAVYAEKSMQTAKAGTVRQRKDWGVGNEARPYTNEDCMKQMNDLTAAGQFDKAKKVSGLIQENLAGDNLRKKDIRPADIIRVDEITDRLEKAGLLKNGKQCSPDEMFEYFFGRKPRYPYTADAVDQMILINENRMRQNDGMPELSMLPDEMRIHDELGEFAETPNAQEKEAYDKLGLVRMPPLKDGKN